MKEEGRDGLRPVCCLYQWWIEIRAIPFRPSFPTLAARYRRTGFPFLPGPLPAGLAVPPDPNHAGRLCFLPKAPHFLKNPLDIELMFLYDDYRLCTGKKGTRRS